MPMIYGHQQSLSKKHLITLVKSFDDFFQNLLG